MEKVKSNKEVGDTDVVIVGIISRDRDGLPEYLLVSSKKDYGAYTGFYYPPGGHAVEGETIESALRRELKEELGVDFEVGDEIAKTEGDVKKQTTYWMGCTASSFQFDIQDENVAGITWMTGQEIADSDKVWPATKEFFKKYTNNRGLE